MDTSMIGTKEVELARAPIAKDFKLDRIINQATSPRAGNAEHVPCWNMSSYEGRSKWLKVSIYTRLLATGHHFKL